MYYHWVHNEGISIINAKNFQQLCGVAMAQPGNTKGGSITLPLTSCLTGLESAVWQLTIFVYICKKPYLHQSNRRSTVQWHFPQGPLKGEVLLYSWPPVWPVWISLFCKQKQKFSVVTQHSWYQPGQKGGQWYSDTSPFSIPWLSGKVLAIKRKKDPGFAPQSGKAL